MPSMQAPDSPRRPIRRIQRTRESCRARPRTTSQVPSGELSSTNTTSQATPFSVASSRRYSTVTLSRSLKVGTTTESCGKPVACNGVSGPGLMASFMGPAYIRSRQRCQGRVPGRGADRWKKQAKTGPNMPTTTNRRARVHPALPGYSWSSQRRSFLSVDVAVTCQIGMPRAFRKGALSSQFASINWALPESPGPSAPREPAASAGRWPAWPAACQTVRSGHTRSQPPARPKR